VRVLFDASKAERELGWKARRGLPPLQAISRSRPGQGWRADRVFQGALNMKCPVCGAAELIHDTRDITYTYKGESTTIPDVKGKFCPACDESVTDMAETDRVMREMQAFNRQINAAIVDPVFIASVRKKLNLGQREAADIFGGGINA